MMQCNKPGLMCESELNRVRMWRIYELGECPFSGREALNNYS